MEGETLLKIAFRNVFRQRRRSLLTAMAMLGGFVLASFSIAWGDGTYGDVIRSFTHNQLGDVEIHARGYLDRPSLYRNLSNYERIGALAGSQRHVEHWAPRLYGGGLASAGVRTTAVRIVGIAPDRETSTTGFAHKVTSGRVFSANAGRETILGKELAEQLNLSIGAGVALVSQASDGSIANDLFTVTGLISTGDVVRDRTELYLPLHEAQEFFALGDRVHEIAITLDRSANAREAAAEISAALSDPNLSVEAWQEFAQDFYRAMKADMHGMWIMLFIIILIVAVGVLNTVLMSVLERQREYGVLLALGTRPWGVFRMVIYEANFLALGSVLAGGAIALALNYLFSIHGVTLLEAYSYGGVTFDRFRTELDARSFLIPAASVALATVTVAIFPALRAARTDPARSMRMH